MHWTRMGGEGYAHVLPAPRARGVPRRAIVAMSVWEPARPLSDEAITPAPDDPA